MKNSIWRFPKIGVPPVIIHFQGIFHYKPSSYWGSPMAMETPIWTASERPCFFSSAMRRSQSIFVSPGETPLLWRAMRSVPTPWHCRHYRAMPRELWYDNHQSRILYITHVYIIYISYVYIYIYTICIHMYIHNMYTYIHIHILYWMIYHCNMWLWYTCEVHFSELLDPSDVAPNTKKLVRVPGIRRFLPLGEAIPGGFYHGKWWFNIVSAWWFGTFYIFPYIGNNHPNWLSYFSEGFKPPTRFNIVSWEFEIILKATKIYQNPKEVQQKLSKK